MGLNSSYKLQKNAFLSKWLNECTNGKIHKWPSNNIFCFIDSTNKWEVKNNYPIGILVNQILRKSWSHIHLLHKSFIPLLFSSLIIISTHFSITHEIQFHENRNKREHWAVWILKGCYHKEEFIPLVYRGGFYYYFIKMVDGKKRKETCGASGASTGISNEWNEKEPSCTLGTIKTVFPNQSSKPFTKNK